MISYDDSIEQLYKELDALRRKTAKYDKRKYEIVKELELLKNKRDEEKYKHITKDTTWDNIDWDELLECESSTTMHKSNALSRLFEQTGRVLSAESYNPETNQRVLKVILPYKNKVAIDECVKRLNFLLPYIKEYKNKITISIFENSLSRYGIKTLIIQDSKYKINDRVYGSDRILKEFTTLQEAIQYISENFWYGEPHPEDDDD